VTFDVFGDFETRGYLRNSERLKNLGEVKRLEHRVFLKNLGRAVEHLKHVERLTYWDVLDTHRVLFRDAYPWAGEDRQTTAPDLAIGKGERNDLFAHPRFMQDAVHYALRLGQDRAYMTEPCGEVMGYLAHAHPFLEGNGRTLMVVLNELAYRAGISIDWSRTDKDAYLQALTRELDRLGAGELDNYLKPFVGPAKSHENSTALLAELRSLGSDRTLDDD
jgi:cell filamentation protein